MENKDINELKDEIIDMVVGIEDEESVSDILVAIKIIENLDENKSMDLDEIREYIKLEFGIIKSKDEINTIYENVINTDKNI